MCHNSTNGNFPLVEEIERENSERIWCMVNGQQYFQRLSLDSLDYFTLAPDHSLEDCAFSQTKAEIRLFCIFSPVSLVYFRLPPDLLLESRTFPQTNAKKDRFAVSKPPRGSTLSPGLIHSGRQLTSEVYLRLVIKYIGVNMRYIERNCLVQKSRGELQKIEHAHAVGERKEKLFELKRGRVEMKLENPFFAFTFWDHSLLCVRWNKPYCVCGWVVLFKLHLPITLKLDSPPSPPWACLQPRAPPLNSPSPKTSYQF